MHKALPFEQAVQEHGPGIKRAYTYKALNKLIQGSAADMTKKSMLDLYKEGIVAHIQIHDELDISVESKEQEKKLLRLWRMLLSWKSQTKLIMNLVKIGEQLMINYGLSKRKYTGGICTD